MATSMASQSCRFIGRPGGCWFGEKCRFSHDVKPDAHRQTDDDRPICKFYCGPGTCRYGNSCYYKHVERTVTFHQYRSVDNRTKATKADDGKPRKLSTAQKYLSVEINNKTKAGNKKMKDGKAGEDEKEAAESVCSQLGACSLSDMSTSFSQSECNTSASVSQNESDVSSPQNESDVSSPGSHDISKTVICGECGAKFSTGLHLSMDGKKSPMRLLSKGSDDKESDDDDKESDDDDEESVDDNHKDDNNNDPIDPIDPLEEHYLEMMMTLDKEHTKFLSDDARFKHSTSCGVCGRGFGHARSLLCHIVGKVKANKEEAKDHRDFLESIIMGFWNRDHGLEEEDECKDWLLMHLVDSYEGSSDSDNSDITDFEGLLGLMALGKHLQVSIGMGMMMQDNDSDSDDNTGMFGFNDDECFELACQGIKPCDPEAADALAVLYDY